MAPAKTATVNQQPLAEVFFKIVWTLTELGREIGMSKTTIYEHIVNDVGDPVGAGKAKDGPRWVQLYDPPVRIPTLRDHNGNLTVSAELARALIRGAGH